MSTHIAALKLTSFNCQLRNRRQATQGILYRFTGGQWRAVLVWLFATCVPWAWADENPPPAVWDLSHLYKNEDEWRQARLRIEDSVSQLETCRGQLATAAHQLADCLQRSSDTYRALGRLYAYSFLAKDIDLNNSATLERHGLADDLFARYTEATSFFEPEILAIGHSTLQRWLSENSALDNFDFKIKNLLRRAPHVLPAREEQILAAAQSPLRLANDAYTVLTNADIPWPEIVLSTGQKAKLTPAAYTQYRGAPARADREAVFDQFFGTYSQFQQTLATTLAGHIRAQAFAARMRGYPSSLHQALAVDNIPEQVYRTLVSSVNRNLPTLHRYLKLRARKLDLTKPRYYDVYPAISENRTTYTLEASRNLLSEALQPMGERYRNLFDQASRKPWIHAYPAEGKRSGAYQFSAAYDVHPYMLLNHNDDFESLTTYAHEWGHALHSLLANDAQPFEKSEYPTFIAELASSAHELLLYKYLAANATSDEERLYFLFEELQGLRGTFFRQTQFAEFELAAYEVIDKGGALSAEKLNTLYGDILKRYYGHDEGVTHIDEAYTVEWAYIPHFYRNFYVYQYATSISAAYHLVEKILAGDNHAREQYLDLLRTGGAEYPYEVLKKAGVDLASETVYASVVKRCNALMDEIENILDSADAPSMAQTPR